MSRVHTISPWNVHAIAFGLLVLGYASTAHGARGGIGIEIAIQDGWLTVVRALDNTPASRAGLLPGDRISKIDGESMHNVDFGTALPRLAGTLGSQVALTILRKTGDTTEELVVTLTRENIRPGASLPKVPGESPEIPYVPTKRAREIEWHGNKIVSRVLPYPDLVSLFIRLPIAHAVATGQDVKIAVIQRSNDESTVSLIQAVAPDAQVLSYADTSDEKDVGQWSARLTAANCRIAVIPDADAWPDRRLVQLARTLLAEKLAVIVPSDLSENADKIETINALHQMGSLTVGRVDRQSMVMQRTGTGVKAFNSRIRAIETDMFSTVGLAPDVDSKTPAATTAGVAALLLERWPEMNGPEVRRKITGSAREVWQATSIETGQWMPSFTVDPVTTQYTPTDENVIFRFRVLDAAAALEVDTEIPWFLNMMNCHKAWEITRGKGATVVVSDQGFHIRHPDLTGHITDTRHFGPQPFDAPNQNFHGTDMSRILLAVAPEAKIIPVLCSAQSMEELPPNIAKSFEFAAERKVDVITASWSGRFNTNDELLAAVRAAVDSGVVVSWFHYPHAHPGVLRSSFTYAWWNDEPRLGFADRFLTDPPGFHPVKIEAGLSGTAPQAAGLAALVRSANPGLTPPEVEQLIFDNSDRVGQTVLVPDAYRIVQAAQKKTQHDQG